jgi:hypothetical protein
MMTTTTTTTTFAAFALLALALGAGCSKAPPCGPKFDAAVAECSCAGPGSGSVWGSGIYTTDSALCSAAIHSGAIPPGGGTISPKPAAGCPAYVGSAANGVTTSNWASYGSSFVFPGHGDGKCAAAPAGGVAPARAGVAQGGACPRTLGEFADASTAQEFTCTCAAGASGSFYGTGVYTADSVLCVAAIHAGANAPGVGGAVKIKKAPGCPKYTATAANGLTSTAWGAYGASFFFDGHGDGKCAP